MTHQIRCQPLSFFLELVDDGRVNGRDGQVQLLVADLQVDVGETEVRLPHQRSDLFHRLKGLGVALQTLGHLNVFRN